MMRALRSAASGMYAQQLNLDMISNNLANVNTTAFKKASVEFQDLIYQTVQASGSVRSLGTVVPTELRIGHGVKPVAIERSFSQGSPTVTNNPLDMAIEGDGFFKVTRADGSIAYTRDGNFKRSPDGRLVNADGYPVEPEISIPDDAVDIAISRDGIINVTTIGSTDQTELGQFEMARFVNAAGLSGTGQNLFAENESSGPPIFGHPGSEGFGELNQGYLEASNVSVVEEMVNMIVAQRAYELSSKAIKTAEDMLYLANNLKR